MVRVIRNVGNAGRAVVVTIHQPSIEIFEVHACVQAAEKINMIPDLVSTSRTKRIKTRHVLICPILHISFPSSHLTHLIRHGFPIFLFIPRHPTNQAFDNLLLLQRGGRTTYFGALGAESKALVAYLEAVPGQCG